MDSPLRDMENRNLGELLTMFLVEGYLEEDDILPVLKKGTAKMMGEKEEKIFTQPLQKESGWEKEFEKVMGCIPECATGLYEDVGCPAHGYDAMKAVKFFRGVIANREKEIAEEVEKLVAVYGYKFTEDDGRSMLDMCDGYNEAIKDVLQILKH